MSTAFLHCRPESKARAACRYAAGVPGAARKPPTHQDVGAASGFPCRGRALVRNVPAGTRQPRMGHTIRSVRQGPAENLAPGDGFPSPTPPQQRRKAHIRHSPPLTLSQPLQLRSHRILHVVTQALADSGLSPHRLELELTESALVENLEQTSKILADLKTLGVSLALDDFGTGYSSLSHLHQFNFDKIKIDRSFVQSFGQRRESAAVVNAVVHLARDLGILMTAEGVETAEHMKAMQDVGCHQVQGYLLGKPQALNDTDVKDDRESA